MPPFKLECPTRTPPHHRSARIIYTKNQYCEGVKIRGWQELLEHKPIDVDPFCGGKVNHFLSHYNRFGSWTGNGFTTTTNEAANQIFVPEKSNPNKRMFNYYTFNDNAECLNVYPKSFCPEERAADYSTTMQHSYQLPYPYAMKRLACPVAPLMQNRKYRSGVTDASPCKFYDESFHFEACEMRDRKAFRWTSYNPLTQTYTPTEGKQSD